MNRLIAIALCICGTVVCAFIAWLGYQTNMEDEAAKNEAPPAVTCGKLLKDMPGGLRRLTLTEFRGGKHYVGYDDDNDGKWDRVFLPTFPRQVDKLKQNYRAVIICFANVADAQELTMRLSSQGVEAEYWNSSQRLDANTYNRLAEDYISMDFDRCVILHVGFPPRLSSFGNLMFWGAAAGVLLSLLGLGWQTFSLLLAGIRKVSEEDDEDIVITNRAELPTVESS